LWDFSSAQRVDVFVANSRFIAERIRKTYGRVAEVIYPPVDVDAFPLCREKQDFYFTASRLVPYKKVDLIIEAFRKMPDKRLVVIGQGPMFKRWAAQAPANVEMLGYQPPDVLRQYMARAKAFIFAAEEDFGITPVEAQACGTPVLAYGRGGSLETVLDGVTGRFFADQTAESIADLIADLESTGAEFDPTRIRSHACSFSKVRFRSSFAALVQRHWTEFRRGRRPAGRKTDVGFDADDSNDQTLESDKTVVCKGQP